MAVSNRALLPDFLFGTSDDDIINDFKVGGALVSAGNNPIDPFAGDDSLVGVPGNESLAGGRRRDWTSNSSATGGVSADLALPDYQRMGAGEALDLLGDVGSLVGSNFGGFPIRNVSNNTLWGGAADDTPADGLSDDMLNRRIEHEAGEGGTRPISTSAGMLLPAKLPINDVRDAGACFDGTSVSRNLAPASSTPSKAYLLPTSNEEPEGQNPGPFGDTVPGSIATTFTLSSASHVRGYVNTSGDQDWYRINLVAGQQYTFTLNGFGLGAISDPYLRVFGSTGTLVDEDDDGGPLLGSRLTYTPSTTGTYYVSAGGFSTNTGQYILTMNDGATPYFPVATVSDIADYLSNSFWEVVGGAARSWATSSVTFNVQGLESERATLARLAFQTWSDICNLTFVETIASAQITVDDFEPNAAYAATNVNGSSIVSSFINVSADWYSGIDDVDSYTLQTFIHEIGHAVGLGHAGPYNGVASYGEDNVYANDSWQLSIMSYMSQDDYGSATFRFVMTPQRADILAANQIYGAATIRSGDTVYGYGSTAGFLYDFSFYGQAPALTIYDSGGTDTLNAFGYAQNQTIDLTGGSYSNIGGLLGNIGIYDTTVIENAVGGPGNDTIIGNQADNTLTGNAGDDALDGGAGNDAAAYAFATSSVTVSLAISGAQAVGGGQGSDTLIGIENLTGSSFDDVLTGDSGDNVLMGLAGNDTLDGGGDNDTASYSQAASGVWVDLLFAALFPGLPQPVSGDQGADILFSIENLIGSNYDDTLLGDATANRLSGLAGDDTLEGGTGDDTLDGGAGNDDAAAYASATSGVTVSLAISGAQAVGGGLGSDTLIGIEGLVGSNFDDVLTGDGGDNRFLGLASDDVLDGGAGIDAADYEAASGPLTVNLAIAGPQTVGGEFGNDTLINIENVEGFLFDDILTGNSQDNGLYGDGGNDTLIGGDGNDTLEGGTQDDALDGGAGVDTASYSDAIGPVTVNLALAGAQVVGGSLGSDTLTSIETLIGSDFGDQLTGDASANTLNGGAGDDTLSGDSGDDLLAGGPGDDSLGGDSGDDLLMGGPGNDSLGGGSGSDGASYAGATGGVTVDLTLSVYQSVGGGEGMDILGDIENLIGSSFDDILTGNLNNNTLNGGAGNDTLSGGLGDDTLDGGAGVDTASYADATSGVTLSLLLAGAQAVGGGLGTDTLTGIESLVGSDFVDVLRGDNGANTLNGELGNDQLIGNNGNDTLIGGEGNDYLDGVGGNDAMTGGPGNDLYIVNTGQDVVTEALNEGTNDSISTFVSMTIPDNVESVTQLGTGNTFIIGNSLDNLILGNAGNNALAGGQGNDVLRGNAGNDILDGNIGIDTVNYAATTGGVTVSLLVTGPQAIGSGEGTDTLANIESLVGSPFNDTLLGDNGANTLDGRTGNDILIGNNGNDTLIGGEGNDYLDGVGGNDTMQGGPGNDLYIVNTGQDVVTEALNEGTNDSVSSFVSMTIPDNVESVTQLGMGNTFIIGNGLDNLIIGNAGNNSLAGGPGNDVLRGGPGDDTISGNAGIDTANYADATSGVSVDLSLAGPQAVGGGRGSDTLSSLENILGSPFDDTLSGDGGANTLTGGAGSDILIGNAGNDVFRYGDADHGGDVVTDFALGADSFNFVSANFGALAPGQLLATNFTLDAPTDSDDLFVFLTGSKTLTFDADGNGATAALTIATLSNGVTLSNTDIAIVAA